MMKLHQMLLVAALLLGASGCGQSGDLYLPESTNTPSEQPSPSQQQ